MLHPTDPEGNPGAEAVAVGDLRVAITLEARPKEHVSCGDIN